MTGRWSDDGHLGWRISALLDGELGVTEEIVAREHLAGCDACQQEFAEVMVARNFVRGLGEVEPPAGFLDRALRAGKRRGPPRFGVIGLVTLALIWVVVLLFGAGTLTPEVELLTGPAVAGHRAAAADPEAVSDQPGVSVIDPSDPDSVRAPYVLPASLPGGLERAEVFDRGDGLIQVVYRSDGSAVSVFEQEGRIDRASLPAGAEERTIGDRTAWIVEIDGVPPAQVVVIEDGALVYTVVGTGDAAQVVAAAEGLPPPRGYSWGDRIRRNVEYVMDRLGLDD